MDIQMVGLIMVDHGKSEGGALESPVGSMIDSLWRTLKNVSARMQLGEVEPKGKNIIRPFATRKF